MDEKEELSGIWRGCDYCGVQWPAALIDAHESDCKFRRIDMAVDRAWESNNAAAQHSWG